jgi:uncharacterized protein YgbK (DUF1537 family)
MIAVIADDFTGAAEIAGIGRRYQLTVQLCMGVALNAEADLIVISTDSRSMSLEDALVATNLAIQSLMPLQPIWIYKKTDSVLRGYVVDELILQMELQKMNRAILLAANPSLGRTIQNGCYFIHGVSIEQTNFNTDPEFAIHQPEIQYMLRAGESVHLHIAKMNTLLPQNGIIVGEASTIEDLAYWITTTNENTILAGAGDAFEMLLIQHTQLSKRSIHSVCNMQLPALYLNGSKCSDSDQLFRNKDASVLLYFSAAILSGKEDVEWDATINDRFQENKKVLIAIDDQIVQQLKIPALALRNRIAVIIKNIITQWDVKELCIEGGATAAAILQALDLVNFIPKNELARGVIRMKATNTNLYITVKPGTYILPETIVQHYLH